MTAVNKCACLDNDATVCYGLRNYGHYPYYDPEEADGHEEECLCSCHGEWQDDGRYDDAD
jgi:hypothetical protein